MSIMGLSRLFKYIFIVAFGFVAIRLILQNFPNLFGGDRSKVAVDSGQRTRKEIYNFDLNKCPAADIKLRISDNYITGVLDQGTEVKLSLNWFSCHPVEAGMLVAHRYSEFHDPVIRRVAAVAGDKIEAFVIANKNKWAVKINGEIYLDHQDNPFIFGDVKVNPHLENFERDQGGILAEGQVILLSTVSPGGMDSVAFGVVSTSDLIGLVTPIKPKEENKQPDAPEGEDSADRGAN